MAHKLISKAEAIKQGLTTYHTGKVCSKGHDAPRYTNSDKCIECHKERNARRDWSKTGKAKAEPKKKPVHWQQLIHPDVAYERDIR